MDEIIVALKSIENQGSFCADKAMDANRLPLRVNKLSLSEFPLQEKQIKELITMAKPAKFGLRDQTLYDPTVRNVWEITKTKISITKTTWRDTIKPLLDYFKEALGLPQNAILNAELHNLLIYEPGNFFKPHQDTEKMDGMVATMVIILPTEYQGGELIIEHGGVKKTYRMTSASQKKLSCIAFYADCYHEIKEVIAGHRVSLTFNLFLEKYKGDLEVIFNPDFESKLKKALNNYFFPKTKELQSTYEIKSPRKMIYLLDHQYTQKSLTWEGLKNNDALRVKALLKQADTMELDAYLALADMQETWECEFDYDEYRYRRGKYYDEDEEDEEENDDEEGSPSYIVDANTVLKQWVDRVGNSVDFEDYSPRAHEVGWTGNNEKFKPYETEYEPYMGNYGNTLDRWYHRAAIVLWRREDHHAVFFEMNPSSVIQQLSDLSQQQSQEKHIREIIKSLLPYWSSHLHNRHEDITMSNLLKLALYVNDAKLAERMLSDFNMKMLALERIPLFLLLQTTYGLTLCISLLEQWTSKKHWGHSTCENLLEVMKKLSEEKNKNEELIDWLLNYHFEKIKEEDLSRKKHDNRAEIIAGETKRISHGIHFIHACLVAHHYPLCKKILTYITNEMELYPPLALIEVIRFLGKNVVHDDIQSEVKQLFQQVLSALKKEQAQGLRDANNWSINDKLTCTCEDCKILTKFLQSDITQTLRWPMGKDRRSHIHRTIDGLGIPVTHQTEHTGSPHKLILTKTDKLYQNVLSRFRQINEALSWLEELGSRVYC